MAKIAIKKNFESTGRSKENFQETRSVYPCLSKEKIVVETSRNKILAEGGMHEFIFGAWNEDIQFRGWSVCVQRREPFPSP